MMCLLHFSDGLASIVLTRMSTKHANEDEHEACKLQGGVNKREIFPINVSKAFRRLTAYATRMDEQKDVLIDPPLTLESVRQAKDLLYSRVTHDDCGRVVWWLDLGQTNFKEMKHLAHEEILRFFVWLSHLIMTDESAQRNGIMFLDSMDSVSFYQYMTMLPYQIYDWRDPTQDEAGCFYEEADVVQCRFWIIVCLFARKNEEKGVSAG